MNRQTIRAAAGKLLLAHLKAINAKADRRRIRRALTVEEIRKFLETTASDVHPKVAQTIMRHSTVDLTLNRYSHIYRGQESEVVNKLPDLSLPSSQRKAKATGTEGTEKNLASYLAFSCGKQRISTDSNGRLDTKSSDAQSAPKSVSKAPKRHFQSENAKGEPLRVVGLEPTTHGLKGRCSAD